jgi:hypothetical protein
MAVMGSQPKRITRLGPGFAYLMTGTAIACICVSGVLGSIFTPDLVTGSQHQHLPIAAFTAWIWNAIAMGIVVTVAIQGIRAEVTDRAPWTVLGLGVGAIWLGVMFVAIFAPVGVTGTDPTKIPVWARLSAIAGVILTAILCNFVQTASFQPAEPKAELTATTPPIDLRLLTHDGGGKEPPGEDADH